MALSPVEEQPEKQKVKNTCTSILVNCPPETAHVKFSL